MTPPSQNARRSLSHDQWAEVMKRIYAREGTETAVGECAYMCWKVLELCGDTEELAQFLDDRALHAFREADKNER